MSWCFHLSELDEKRHNPCIECSTTQRPSGMHPICNPYYSKRQSIERVFRSLKAPRSLEGHHYRGYAKVLLHATLSVLGLPTTALARCWPRDYGNLLSISSLAAYPEVPEDRPVRFPTPVATFSAAASPWMNIRKRPQLDRGPAVSQRRAGNGELSAR